MLTSHFSLKIISALALPCALLFARPTNLTAAEVLNGHDPIEIPNSRGGFDYLQVDAVRNRLLLDHTGNGTLDIIDLATETLIKQIKTGAAMGVAMDAKSRHYYVSVSKEKKLVIIDAEKLEITGEVPLPGPGDALAVGPTGVNRVFVGHDDEKELWVIDPVAKNIVTTIPIAAGPEYIVVENDKSLVYMNIKSDDTVLAISASDNNSTIASTWPTAPAKHPHGLALDLRAPRRLFVAGVNGKLVVLSTDGGKAVGAVDMVNGVDQIGFDAVKDRLYCPSGNGKMTVMNTSGGTVKTMGDVVTNKGARTVTVDPKTHAVWVAYSESGKCFARKFTLVE